MEWKQGGNILRKKKLTFYSRNLRVPSDKYFDFLILEFLGVLFLQIYDLIILESIWEFYRKCTTLIWDFLGFFPSPKITPGFIFF